MTEVCDKKICTGCSACFNICPKSAISMVEDDFGFVYPKIDLEVCFDCGICSQICPANNSLDFLTPQKVYAAINKNQFDYHTATSGGIATLFARDFIKKGGSVYGVAFSKHDINFEHIRIECDADIEKIKGSKYVQSDTSNVFVKIRQDLENDLYVLYIGTPCQVAGLKNYLKKDYSKLLTCDLVCHGTPSQKMLKEHLENFICLQDVKKISFRDKQGFYLTVYGKEDVIYRKRNFNDVFYLGFLKSLFYRESCYNCKYAQHKRFSDITLGDFWGFDTQKGEFPATTSNGLSLVLINTEKGNTFFEDIKDDLIYLERTLSEAVAGNRQLRHPSVKHKNYEKFIKAYSLFGFKKSANKCLRKERLIYGILDRIGK